MFTPEQHVHIESWRGSGIERLVQTDFTEIPDNQSTSCWSSLTLVTVRYCANIYYAWNLSLFVPNNVTLLSATDEQTDSILIARPCLHGMQHGKKDCNIYSSGHRLCSVTAMPRSTQLSILHRMVMFLWWNEYQLLREFILNDHRPSRLACLRDAASRRCCIFIRWTE